MKLIIAGYGFVGKAVHNALKSKHDVVIVDPKHTQVQIKDHLDAEGIIICVDTPENTVGGCDGNNIANVLDEVPLQMPVLIKSSITPEVIQALETIYPDHSIVVNPEFLRARSANQDFLNQTFTVIGGEDPECFWQDLWQECLPNLKIVFNCSAIEACIIKYSINSFLALKTSFFNQIHDVCKAGGADFDVVRQIVAYDSRIGSSHTMVPGPDGEYGWGGACFPKDTKAFVHYSKSIDRPISLIESAIIYNNKIRKTS